MRRSSRGNPWHDAEGKFCHGPEATVDTWGNPISDEQRQEAVKYCEAEESEYQRRSESRGIMLGSKYYSKDIEHDPPTDKQKRFAESISEQLEKELPEPATKKSYSDFIAENAEDYYRKKPAREENIPDARPRATVEPELVMPTNLGEGEDGAVEFQIACADAFGINRSNISFYSEPLDGVDGDVYGIPVGDRYCVLECTVECIDNKANQTHNTYHEIFHAARNDAVIISEEEFDNGEFFEEAKAEVAAFTLCRANGVNDASSVSYSSNVISVIPRLKQMEKYKDCHTLEDFGKIFISERKKRANAVHKEERDYIKGISFSEGAYFSQYKSEADKHFDKAFYECENPAKRKENRRDKFREEYEKGFALLASGKSLKDLDRNQRKLISACIRKVMEEKGVL